MSTVLFVYTEGVTYKATHVVNINHNDSSVEYYKDVLDATGKSVGFNHRVIDKSDLLYAVVRNNETGEVNIIPGLYDSFDIVPKGESVRRQHNIETEAKRVAAYREAKAPEREAKEQEKYEARRAKRKAKYVQEQVDESENVQHEQNTVIETEAVVVSTNTAPKAKGTRKSVNVLEQLKSAGITDEDLEHLRSLGILR